MSANINTNLGKVVIENNVIAHIAGISAMESYGIVGMGSKNATDGLLQIFKFDNLAKGIQVYSEEGVLNITLHVVLEYGVRISTVGNNIIDRVKFNVENLTGLTVDKIEVLVEGIRTE